MEDRMEREVSRKGRKERRSKERSRNMEEEEEEEEAESVNLEERLRALEDRIKESEKSPGRGGTSTCKDL
jgi:hypothetical protein